jgi:hypothetical protein
MLARHGMQPRSIKFDMSMMQVTFTETAAFSPFPCSGSSASRSFADADAV